MVTLPGLRAGWLLSLLIWQRAGFGGTLETVWIGLDQCVAWAFVLLWQRLGRCALDATRRTVLVLGRRGYAPGDMSGGR